MKNTKLKAVLCSETWNGGSDHSWHDNAWALILDTVPVYKIITVRTGWYSQSKYQDEYEIVPKSSVENFDKLLVDAKNRNIQTQFNRLFKMGSALALQQQTLPLVGRRIEVIGGIKYRGKFGIVKRIIDDRYADSNSSMTIKQQMIMSIVTADEKSFLNKVVKNYTDLKGKVLIVTDKNGNDFFIKPSYAKVLNPGQYTIEYEEIEDWAAERSGALHLQSNLSRI
jgi:hypothetical protein